jgi:uncharacterized protein YegP (UPF0339 family)
VLLGAPTSLTESSTNAEEPEAVTRAPKLEIYPDTSGKYRWRLRAANNEIVASSGQDFASKSGAREAAEAQEDIGRIQDRRDRRWVSDTLDGPARGSRPTSRGGAALRFR